MSATVQQVHPQPAIQPGRATPKLTTGRARRASTPLVVGAPVPYAPRVKRSNKRDIDFSGLAALEPGYGIPISGASKQLIKRSLEAYTNAYQLHFTPKIGKNEDGTIIVYRPVEG